MNRKFSRRYGRNIRWTDYSTVVTKKVFELDREILLAEYKVALHTDYLLQSGFDDFDLISIWGWDFRIWPENRNGTIVFREKYASRGMVLSEYAPSRLKNTIVYRDLRVLKTDYEETKIIIEQLNEKIIDPVFVKRILEAKQMNEVEVIASYIPGEAALGKYEIVISNDELWIYDGEIDVMKWHSSNSLHEPDVSLNLSPSEFSKVVNELNKGYIDPEFLKRLRVQYGRGEEK